MQAFGRRFTNRISRDQSGVATIAELLIVMAVSSILLIAVLNGQEFVTRLSQRFFDRAALVTEARIILEIVQFDLSQTEQVRHPSEEAWLLLGWMGDTVEYRYSDSSLFRDGRQVPRKDIRLSAFGFSVETSRGFAQREWPGESLSGREHSLHGSVLAHVGFELRHKDKSISAATVQRLSKRAPGT